MEKNESRKHMHISHPLIRRSQEKHQLYYIFNKELNSRKIKLIYKKASRHKDKQRDAFQDIFNQRDFILN